MKKLIIITLFFLTLLLFLSSCNAPAKTTPPEQITEEAVTEEIIIPSTAKKVSHISIISGTQKISPLGTLLWSKKDKQDGTYDESNYTTCDVKHLVSGKAGIPVSDIPTIVLDEKISYSVQVNGQVNDVLLLTPKGNDFIKSETTFEELSTLAPGTYFVVVEVLLHGNCDPSAPQNSAIYEDVFCLIVKDNAN